MKFAGNSGLTRVGADTFHASYGGDGSVVFGRYEQDGVRPRDGVLNVGRDLRVRIASNLDHDSVVARIGATIELVTINFDAVNCRKPEGVGTTDNFVSLTL